LIQGIELDEEKFKFDEKDDVFSISNVLKQCQYRVGRFDPSLQQTCGSYLNRFSTSPMRTE